MPPRLPSACAALFFFSIVFADYYKRLYHASMTPHEIKDSRAEWRKMLSAKEQNALQELDWLCTIAHNFKNHPKTRWRALCYADRLAGQLKYLAGF